MATGARRWVPGGGRATGKSSRDSRLPCKACNRETAKRYKCAPASKGVSPHSHSRAGAWSRPWKRPWGDTATAWKPWESPRSCPGRRHRDSAWGQKPFPPHPWHSLPGCHMPGAAAGIQRHLPAARSVEECRRKKRQRGMCRSRHEHGCRRPQEGPRCIDGRILCSPRPRTTPGPLSTAEPAKPQAPPRVLLGEIDQ